MKFDGRRLKERREKMGFSLQELGNLCQITKSYIWELEQDKGMEPGGVKVFLMSKALGVPMEWFYGEDNQEDVKQAIVRLAHGVATVIGIESYYEVCKLVYPDFEVKK